LSEALFTAVMVSLGFIAIGVFALLFTQGCVLPIAPNSHSFLKIFGAVLSIGLMVLGCYVGYIVYIKTSIGVI
jgi:hypothetical protein